MRIVLVQMPFAVTTWPSLGLSLLKAILRGQGHEVRIAYHNRDFSDAIGAPLYSKIANGAPQNVDLAGEWAFASALWGPDAAADRAYLDAIIRGGDPAHAKPIAPEAVRDLAAALAGLPETADTFVEQCASAIDWADVDLVGFTSTFQQHCASLALAKRLKARHPRLRVIFGGANCEAEMGAATLRNFPFVDAVCTGEGDIAFPAYVAALEAGDGRAVDGILARDAAGAIASRPAARVADLDALPYPDFDDFFEGQEQGSDAFARVHRLVLETSRGCWWGQKNHCTFCGLNGQTMRFRQKSGDRALAELDHLMTRYGAYTRRVTATDNIMPYDYFASFLPRLAALGMDLSLFYETKANLKKDQLDLYRRAGLSIIQPGIESLSTDVLRLMRKGVSALQNIQLLKWCREFAIEAKWNYLAGFPGERPETYAAVAPLVRKLTHLMPPIGASRLRFDRFSPYFQTPVAFAITRLDPYPAYAHVYRGLAAAEIADLAYFFHGAFTGDEAVEGYTAEAFAALNRWKDEADERALFHIAGDDLTLVFDTRGDEALVYVLDDDVASVFAACDGITAAASLDALPLAGPSAAAALDLLLAHAIFHRDGDEVINLSVPLDSDYVPPNGSLVRLQRFLAPADGGEPSLDQIDIRLDDVIRLSTRPAIPPADTREVDRHDHAYA